MISTLSIAALLKHLKSLIWLLVLAVSLLFACIASLAYMQDQTEAVEVEKVKAIEQDTLSPEIVSKAVTIANILRNPQRYHNQSVWVKGYLHLEFEGDGLYGRKLDYQTHASGRSVGVHFTDSLTKAKPITDYSDHYVLLKGNFDATLGNIEPGTITEITSLNALQTNGRWIVSKR